MLLLLGMLDISKDPDYSKIYERLQQDEPSDTAMLEEMKFFMSHVDDLSMQITMLQVLLYFSYYPYYPHKSFFNLKRCTCT